MKGLILAAGLGTRLRPLTEDRSKPLMLLANRPLIHYAIDKLVEVGIDEIGIVVGQNREELRERLDYPGPRIELIHQPEPLGLAHAVKYAADFCGSDDFILLFCDNLFCQRLHDSVERWQELREEIGDRVCLIHTYKVSDPRAFGVAVLDGERVLELEEKPENPRSNQAVVGIDFFTPAIFESIEKIRPSRRGELEITDAIAQLAASGGDVRAASLEGFWYDTGTFADLIRAHGPVLHELGNFTQEGEARNCRVRGALGTGAGSVIEQCEIEGPVLIGSNVTVRGGRLGPNVSIADNCRIEECRLSECQVYPGTRLRSVTDNHAIYDERWRIDAGGEPQQLGLADPVE